MLQKIKRFFTSLLPIDPQRRGDCNRCGDCCKLPYPCPFLRFDDAGLSSCAVYYFRPPSCRKYPRVSAENLTPQTCGFFFLPPEQIGYRPSPHFEPAPIATRTLATEESH
ncbi:hypothetical protein CKO09_03225 [Chromatium weissei]|nr:hypothetical protein [Chromatium weissei]